ncbi:MAG: MarR family EPS-associated transcriptional regulator [Thermodesulfobacteriota bacterium]
MPQSEETPYHLLKHLDATPDATQRELAGALGISLGKLNYCLKALIAKGWVKAGNFSRNPDKRGYAYLLTPQGVEAKARLTVQFLQAKMCEYDRLQREIEALQQEVNFSRLAADEEET